MQCFTRPRSTVVRVCASCGYSIAAQVVSKNHSLSRWTYSTTACLDVNTPDASRWKTLAPINSTLTGSRDTVACRRRCAAEPDDSCGARKIQPDRHPLNDGMRQVVHPKTYQSGEQPGRDD